MKKTIFLGCFGMVFTTWAQQNCNLLKDDPACYKACKLYNESDMFYQGSYASQKNFDDAIALCPTLSNAYFEKSVAFLKRGMFVEWKQLMDKAVELDPEAHLPYRAWCQFSFLRNYEQCIKDLTALSEIKGTPFIGVGQSGDYDLRIVSALSHRFVGERQKAIEIIETALSDDNYYLGLYDQLHLGVLYLETGQIEKAITALESQLQENPLAEAYYYLAKAHMLNKDRLKGTANAQSALEFYESGRKMHSHYYEFHDQVYKEDIRVLLQSMQM